MYLKSTYFYSLLLSIRLRQGITEKSTSVMNLFAMYKKVLSIFIRLPDFAVYYFLIRLDSRVTFSVATIRLEPLDPIRTLELEMSWVKKIAA